MSQQAKRQIALFDMDGTLFDYEKAMKDLLLEIMPISEHEMIKELDLWTLEEFSYLKRATQIIKRIPGWWRKLPKYHPGWRVYEMAKAIGFEVHILTKGPSYNPQAWAEKLECIREHFGRNEVQVHVTEDKSVHYGRVLVDDFPDYIEAWLEFRPRGQVIMPDHSWNKDFEHPQVIRYRMGHNDQEVKQALREAFNRE